MSFVRDLVYRRSAIVVEPGKEYLVESRLAPLAREQGFASIDAMIDHLRARPANDLQAKVVEAMTTNETSFFRDQHPFEGLKNTILPALQRARSGSKTLRIWSAACSAGQEPYSIAMLLRDQFPELASWDVRILATDLSAAMVARASAGRYSQVEVNRGLPATTLVKHFERCGTEWQIKPEVRRLVQCRQLNLLDPWPVGRHDVVFLRNVLIYFDVPTKQAILSRMRGVLAPDGYLFLGGAETTLKVDETFERIQIDRAVFYRPGDPRKLP
jgi:chemotaxis protein methyltransferase CheR